MATSMTDMSIEIFLNDNLKKTTKVREAWADYLKKEGIDNAIDLLNVESGMVSRLPHSQIKHLQKNVISKLNEDEQEKYSSEIERIKNPPSPPAPRTTRAVGWGGQQHGDWQHVQWGESDGSGRGGGKRRKKSKKKKKSKQKKGKSKRKRSKTRRRR